MMDLLRAVIVGSVDDGKSTLLGRLLIDTKKVFEDQLNAVERASKLKGDEYVNIALLTDGLRAEREQGITIDVAYRYFSTPKRKFIMADCPGHIQYTRNMVTGASTASLGIVLIDARKGILEQTKRHSFVASLLGIPHLVVCINKMDLVDYSEEVFSKIKDDFDNFSARLNIHDITYIPISALTGANIVTTAKEMPWFQGRCLLNHLEEVHISSDRNLIDFRFPVQYVIKPQSKTHPDFRGYSGQIGSGAIRKGEEVVALPSGLATKVKSIYSGETEVEEAFTPMSITITLEHEIDISRGSMLVRPNNQPQVEQDIDAMICWMAQNPLQIKSKYFLLHTTNEVRTILKEINYKVDVNTLTRSGDDQTIGLNEIARVGLRTTQPLLCDSYRQNRLTGSFVLIDPADHNTVAAGMII